MRLTSSSLAMRQALLTTAVAATAIAVFGIVAVTTIDLRSRADLQHTIDTDIAGLSDIMVEGGTAELQRRIADRTDFATSAATRAFYRLEQPDGTAIAGNLNMHPSLDASRSAAGTIALGSEPVLARATQLRGGFRLFVGRSLGAETALIARLGAALAATALATLALSLAIGLFVARRVTRRIALLNTTFDAFGRGDMTARAVITGSDELDRLAAHVDAHLGKIELLFHAQRQISDNVAHELRTPLVHLDARLLQALDSGPAPEIAAQLERARGDIRAIVTMFDALLDIALAESATIGAGVSLIDLSQIATDVADLYTASAEEAGIDFSTRIASDVVMTCDAMQMTRLIANLLDNALKYTRPGGHVRLSVAAGPVLIVEDDGPGVPAAEREHIFQRFHRASPTGHGHGLGLALVSVIAARHALVARVEDALPGARFVVGPA